MPLNAISNFQNEEWVQNQEDIDLGVNGRAKKVVLYDANGNALSSTDTATLSNVNGSNSNQTLLAANTSRKGAIFFNDSSAILYLKFGATATASSFTYRLNPYDTLELRNPIYTGRIDGIWASTTGSCRITELT